MKKKWLLLTFIGLVLAMVLSACSGGSGEEVVGDNVVTDADGDSEEGSSEAVDNDSLEPEDSAQSDEEGNKDRPKAVVPSKIEETVKFTRVSWMMGAPSRQPHAGVWLYTEDEHPRDIGNSFNYDDYDYFLYQIGNEEYLGYVFRAQRIVLEDDDIVRIIVRVHEEPSEDADPSELEMPRQYLQVEKEVLRGKAFIVETEDGEILSLE